MEMILPIALVIGAVGLITQALIGLSYFISSVWEKEKRAAAFAFFQFLAMTAVLIAYLYLIKVGFFETKLGLGVLIAGVYRRIAGHISSFKKDCAKSKSPEGDPRINHR